MKLALRTSALESRAAISAGDREAAARTVGSQVAALVQELCLMSTRKFVVLAYAAYANELDPTPTVEALTALAHDTGRPAPVVVYPRVCGPGELSLHACGRSELTAGYRGILEPPPDAHHIDASEVSVTLVPGVAFGRDLMRLGYGKGFYDRLLPDIGGAKIGLSFDETLYDTVPHEPHDHPLDAVVAPSETVR